VAAKLQELAIGAVFEYRGELFTKQALSMAEAHSNKWGHIFGEEGRHEVMLIVGSRLTNAHGGVEDEEKP